MQVRFTVKGEILTKQRPRATIIGGHARVYTPKSTINYENYIRSEYLRQCNDYYFGDSALEVEVRCFFKANKELEKLGKQNYMLVACDTHKDLDNICKLVDALNGVAWDDDKQIIKLNASKCYNDEEYIEFTIKECETYISLKEAKKEIKRSKLYSRYIELVNKEKRNKSEEKRLLELKEILGKE